MKMTKLRIENYKSLREIDIPLSKFVCLIGENNTGKSSVLQALKLFISGSPLAKTDFFDESHPVRLALSLADLKDIDFELLESKHREKIKAIVRQGRLTLVRLYGTDGKSSLKYEMLAPNDDRFSEENVDKLMKGKKPGCAFCEAVKGGFPELKDIVTDAMNQDEMRAAIEHVAEALPEDQKHPVHIDIPTGIDKSISAMLPEPIYIQAVKDLKDDLKTTDSATFGKVLAILLKAVEPLLHEEKELFESLNRKFNRVVGQDGTERDERMTKVKEIEGLVNRYVNESFRNVELRITIPPPEIKTVLSSATIYADDGVNGPFETKGDGLRRAVVFAILRSYLELRRMGDIDTATDTSTASPGNLLLFEEPELYLHPQAQKVLFDALAEFSKKHPVVVTTHSPSFFGPDATTTFVKLRKRKDVGIAQKPFAVAQPVDLENLDAKHQFQIICYENNSIAFFSETVVLVEGDSDYIVLPHLARVLNPAWDCGEVPIRFARIGGKGSIRRYRQFFEQFGMKVAVITDLDFLLGNEFNQIAPSDALIAQRSRLLQIVDAAIQSTGEKEGPNSAQLNDAHGRGELRSLWSQAKKLKTDFDNGRVEWDIVETAVDKFFAWGKYWPRREVLSTSPVPEVLAAKQEMLLSLRNEGVFVLERGTIEDYYPDSVTGEGKLAEALSFCSMLTTREQAVSLWSSGPGNPTSEFEGIFGSIFGRADSFARGQSRLSVRS
jgi:hypothetical protein